MAVLYPNAVTVLCPIAVTVLCPIAVTVLCLNAVAVLCLNAVAVLCPNAVTVLWQNAVTVLCPNAVTVLCPNAVTVLCPNAVTVLCPNAVVCKKTTQTQMLSFSISSPAILRIGLSGSPLLAQYRPLKASSKKSRLFCWPTGIADVSSSAATPGRKTTTACRFGVWVLCTSFCKYFDAKIRLYCKPHKYHNSLFINNQTVDIF